MRFSPAGFFPVPTDPVPRFMPKSGYEPCLDGTEPKHGYGRSTEPM